MAYSSASSPDRFGDSMATTVPLSQCSDAAQQSMLEIARTYAEQGWSIIPQSSGAKKPLVKWKPFQDTPPSEALITDWWTRFLDAGICLILGPVSGVVAVDVDSLEAEKVFFGFLGGEPKTRKTISGSQKPGKAHYLFRCPGFPTTARYTPLHKELELRGHGGYVVLPPSLHPSGKRYAWAEPTTEIAELPPALADVWRNNPRFQVRHEPPQRHPLGAEIPQSPIVAPNSSRTLLSLLRLGGLANSTRDWLFGRFAHSSGWNQRLFVAACDLAGHGISLDAAEPLLLRGAQPDTPRDEETARRTIQSAFSQTRTPFAPFSAGQYSEPPQRIQPPESGNVIRIISPRRLSQTLRVEG